MLRNSKIQKTVMDMPEKLKEYQGPDSRRNFRSHGHDGPYGRSCGYEAPQRAAASPTRQGTEPRARNPDFTVTDEEPQEPQYRAESPTHRCSYVDPRARCVDSIQNGKATNGLTEGVPHQHVTNSWRVFAGITDPDPEWPSPSASPLRRSRSPSRDDRPAGASQGYALRKGADIWVTTPMMKERMVTERHFCPKNFEGPRPSRSASPPGSPTNMDKRVSVRVELKLLAQLQQSEDLSAPSTPTSPMSKNELRHSMSYGADRRTTFGSKAERVASPPGSPTNREKRPSVTANKRMISAFHVPPGVERRGSSGAPTNMEKRVSVRPGGRGSPRRRSAPSPDQNHLWEEEEGARHSHESPSGDITRSGSPTAMAGRMSVRVEATRKLEELNRLREEYRKLSARMLSPEAGPKRLSGSPTAMADRMLVRAGATNDFEMSTQQPATNGKFTISRSIATTSMHRKSSDNGPGSSVGQASSQCSTPSSGVPVTLAALEKYSPPPSGKVAKPAGMSLELPNMTSLSTSASAASTLTPTLNFLDSVTCPESSPQWSPPSSAPWSPHRQNSQTSFESSTMQPVNRADWI